MPRDARRDPSQPDEDELLPAGLKRRPTLPFGMPAVRAPGRASDSAARPRPISRPATRSAATPLGSGDDLPARRETPVARRIGGFALEPEDERFVAALATELRPHLAWLLGDRRQEFHRELSEGHLDVALDMLLEDRRTNPRNVSASKAAHALRDAIRDHVRVRIGPMDSVPFLLKQPPTASRSHVRVLPLINGVATIEDILGSCQLPLLETIRSLSRLQKAGCIDVPGAAPAPTKAPGPSVKAPATTTKPPGATTKPRRSTSPPPDARTDDDKAPLSSRLTMPEILAPFAEDLEALGVGDGGGLRGGASGVHPVVAEGRAHEGISDPTTPIPDGTEVDAPDDDREAAGEPYQAADDQRDERENERPAAPLCEPGAGSPAAREASPGTDADRADGSAAAEEVADPELGQLGAIWRERARSKSAAPPEPPLEEAPSVRPSRPGFPSIPALDAPAPEAHAPVSRRSRPTPVPSGRRNGRFAATVGAVAAVVIVAMFAVRASRAPAAADAMPAPGPSAPLPLAATTPVATPPPVDTAPAFIDRGTVTFTIKVTPKYARVFLDDVLLVPVTEVKLRREDRQHQLRVEAAGFATREVTVSSKSDASLVIALDRLSAPAKASSSAKAGAEKPAPPATKE